MKTTIKALRFGTSVFLAAALLIPCAVYMTGCSVKAHACDILSQTETIKEAAPESANKSRTAITVNGVNYSVVYKQTNESELNGKTYDKFTVSADGQSADTQSAFITVDSSTDELASFSGITPFSRITDISLLTDEELKTKAEAAIGNCADFSLYNVFTVTKNAPVGDTGTQYVLKWQAKRDMLCNIVLEAYVNSEGDINMFYKTNACADGLKAAFISESERDTLIRDTLCEKMKTDSLSDVEILAETLSLYHGKNAVIYSVKATDSNGFGGTHVLVITQQA